MHDQIKRVPDGDVLIHAGDLTMEGSKSEILQGFAWLARLPHMRIIFTPGNHDFGFQRIPELVLILQSKFPRVETLIDHDTLIDGVRLWASPWQPWFHDWAFNFLPGPVGLKQAEAKWDEIPDDTAILVTHGQVYGVLDGTLRGHYAGDSALKARIARLLNLRLYVGGHIHEAYGTQMVDGVLYVNACSCDSQYWPSHPPIVVDLDETCAQHVPWQEWSKQ